MGSGLKKTLRIFLVETTELWIDEEEEECQLKEFSETQRQDHRHHHRKPLNHQE